MEAVSVVIQKIFSVSRKTGLKFKPWKLGFKQVKLIWSF